MKGLISVILFMSNNSWFITSIGVLVALIGLFINILFKRMDYLVLKQNLLQAIYAELLFNSQWVANILPKGVDAPEYYDPGRANFKCRDDAIAYAITNGQSVLMSDPRLLISLINVSHAVRFLNQQIDEQTLFRFSSPKDLSKLSARLLELEPQKRMELLRKWYCDIKNVPDDLRDYIREMNLRHRAIIDYGFYDQLKPSLGVAIPLVKNELNMAERMKWYEFWKR